MLQRLYVKMMSFSESRYVWWIVGLLSFLESFVLPIPPDPLYITMMLRSPKHTWRISLWCTLTSVLGGIIGYILGVFFYDTWGIYLIEAYGLTDSFAHFQTKFQKYGFWIVALKGMTPIPYKVVTISCGLANMNFYAFILASLLARGSKTFLIGALILRYRLTFQTFMEKNLKLMFFLFIGSLILGFVLLSCL